MIVALDWDMTLVDEEGEWLPDSQATLRWLRKNQHKVIILSSRASYEKGRIEIETKLAQHRVKATVCPKPYADLYVDDKGLRFDGNWPAALNEMRRILR